MDSNTSTIPLTNDLVAIVDADLYEWLNKHSWRAVRFHKSYYAKSTVGSVEKPYDISMHRIVARTPRGMVCHHRNRNSLDNRRANLVNMTKRDHQFLHANNSLSVKWVPSQESHTLSTV